MGHVSYIIVTSCGLARRVSSDRHSVALPPRRMHSALCMWRYAVSVDRSHSGGGTQRYCKAAATMYQLTVVHREVLVAP